MRHTRSHDARDPTSGERLPRAPVFARSSDEPMSEGRAA